MPTGGSRRVISAVNTTCGRDARGVSRSSDVTDQTETGSNRGRALAAGVMPGARDSRAGASNAGVWERGLSRSPPEGGAAKRQGSREAVRASTGGAGCITTTKGLTSISHVCRRVGAAVATATPFRRVGRQPMRSNEDVQCPTRNVQCPTRNVQ